MRAGGKRKPVSEINVVTYIDVMLVLLIIFMVTAPMLQSGVDIDLPESNAMPISADNEQEPLMVNIDATGAMYFGELQLENVQQLQSLLAAEIAGKKGQSIHIRGDKNASYDHIMKAVVAAQLAGATNIGLISDNNELE